MATSSKIFITRENGAVFSAPGLSWASARKVSEVLQHDMENHIYLNNIEFHGASPEPIQLQYEREAKRQRAAFPRDETVIQSFYNKKEFMKHMYQEEQYSNFLAFFQREIDEKGVTKVLNEYLFGGDELAESLLSRMVAGIVHPIMHLGSGAEFQQPAIIAQAIAQASVHKDYLGDGFFQPATKVSASDSERSMNLLGIMEAMRADSKVDGILKRAGAEVSKHCSQWTVPEDQIQEKLVEMINTTIYWTATAQNPRKQLKLDFYFIHAVNLSIFFKAFTDFPYLSASNKSRLLEMKGRMDLLIWASRKMPEPQPDDILNYPIHLGWPEVFVNSYLHPSDDGHLAKFVRTVAFAEELCRPYESSRNLKNLPVMGICGSKSEI
ncbi:hypA-like protein [Lipomyces doorenjongii]|uniref:hypA-like protein n=1 Tax=Lipomyces doorenjongii TaxID=383834 RepID=UPI0034CD0FE5